VDFQNIYADLTKRGIKLVCTEQPIMNTDGAMGSLMPPDMDPSEVYPHDPLSALKRRGGPGGPMASPILA
jgi:hypothetical protein